MAGACMHRWTHTQQQQGPARPDGHTHTHNNQGRTDQMDTHTTRAGWTRWTHTQQQGPDGPDGPTHNNKGRMGQMDTHTHNNKGRMDQTDTHTVRGPDGHTHYKDQIGPRRDWKVGKDGQGLHAETPRGSHTPKCITTGAPGRAACMQCIRAICALLGSRVRKNTIPHYQRPETGMHATLQTLPRTQTHAQTQTHTEPGAHGELPRICSQNHPDDQT